MLFEYPSCILGCATTIAVTYDADDTSVYDVNLYSSRFQMYQFRGFKNDHPYYIGMADEKQGIWFCKDKTRTWVVGKMKYLGKCIGFFTTDPKPCPGDTKPWKYKINKEWKDAGQGIIIKNKGR